VPTPVYFVSSLLHLNQNFASVYLLIQGISFNPPILVLYLLSVETITKSARIAVLVDRCTYFENRVYC